MSALREILAHFGFEVETEKLKDGENAISSMIEKLKGVGEAIAGAFVVKEVFEFAKGMSEAAIDVEHSAAAFGMSTTEMQQWQLAAKISGVAAEDLNTSFRELARRVGQGMGPGVAGLQKLGVNVRDASGQLRPMSELFEDAGAAIGTMTNASERAALGQQVFGRGFVRLLPLLEQGKDGMAALRGELAKLGGGFDEAFIEKSREIEGQSARLSQAWTSLKVVVASYLLPAVVWLTEKARELVLPLIDLLKTTESVHAALAVLGFAGAAAAIMKMAGSARFLLTEVLPLVAAFLLVEDFLTFLSGGKSEFGEIIEGLFGPGSAEKVRKWFNEVFDSVKDLGKDWEDLKIGLQILWTSFVDGSRMSIAQIEEGFGRLWNAIKKGAAYAAAYLSDAFDGAWNGIVEIAMQALGAIAKLPGMGKLGDEIKALGDAKRGGHAVADLDAQKLPGISDSAGFVDAAQAMIHQHQAELVAKYDKVHADEHPGMEGIGTRQPDVTVHVTVPPGTPENIVRDAHRAAEAGAKKGAQSARQTYIATNPGKA